MHREVQATQKNERGEGLHFPCNRPEKCETPSPQPHGSGLTHFCQIFSASLEGVRTDYERSGLVARLQEFDALCGREHLHGKRALGIIATKAAGGAPSQERRIFVVLTGGQVGLHHHSPRQNTNKFNFLCDLKKKYVGEPGKARRTLDHFRYGSTTQGHYRSSTK